MPLDLAGQPQGASAPLLPVAPELEFVPEELKVPLVHLVQRQDLGAQQEAAEVKPFDAQKAGKNADEKYLNNYVNFLIYSVISWLVAFCLCTWRLSGFFFESGLMSFLRKKRRKSR